MNAIETFKVGIYTVEIYYDNDPLNPRIEFEHSDIIVAFHKRYQLGDTTDYRFQNFNGWCELEAQIIKDHDPAVIKPLYMLDHSGITISTTDFRDRWDSGQIGFIFMPRKGAYNTYMTKRITKAIKAKCNDYIESSVKEYNQFLTGSVFGYVIKDSNDRDVDSCWGFYGDIEYVKTEATASAKHNESVHNMLDNAVSI
jgi:hypothetical protein